MLKIGITGQAGFIGSHLYNYLGLYPVEFERIDFQRWFFEDDNKLNEFVSQCDVIVHLAAMNRHHDPQVVFDTNISLVKKLINALMKTKSKAHVLFSSSIQEERDNLYGKSKKEGRELIENWAKISGGKFTGLIIPNVFGPFGCPDYNSVITTFCHKLTHNKIPKIEVDSELKLIYVGELVGVIVREIRNKLGTEMVLVPHTFSCKVSVLLSLLENYKIKYQDKGEIPAINNAFELNLFNTFRCSMDIGNHFPIKYKQHTDSRGSFVELIRLGVGGQMSVSTTVPGVTRGNHFHTRKIERFVVIKGKALIQMRRIGTMEVLDFYLDSNEPSYVDMPIWYTHNIKNIGEDVLYTIFWINEPYNQEDPDTFIEIV
jgi:UDP-2-acetamido-2,6-beta-L-arabino-hexul-4-ose reductase